MALTENVLREFQRIISSKLPTVVYEDSSAYNARLDTMGRETHKKGYEHISICISARFSGNVQALEPIFKLCGKYALSLYGCKPYYLYAVEANGDVSFIDGCGRYAGIPLRLAKYFDCGITSGYASDIIKTKKASLCILITDNGKLPIVPETMHRLIQRYARVVALDLVGEGAVCGM